MIPLQDAATTPEARREEACNSPMPSERKLVPASCQQLVCRSCKKCGTNRGQLTTLSVSPMVVSKDLYSYYEVSAAPEVPKANRLHVKHCASHCHGFLRGGFGGCGCGCGCGACNGGHPESCHAKYTLLERESGHGPLNILNDLSCWSCSCCCGGCACSGCGGCNSNCFGCGGCGCHPGCGGCGCGCDGGCGGCCGSCGSNPGWAPTQHWPSARPLILAAFRESNKLNSSK